MTLASFGYATPVQMDMLELVGYEFVQRDMKPNTMLEARKRTMMLGLANLRKATEFDYGYDVAAWRELLIEFGDEFGYTHPYAFSCVDSAVRAAMDDSEVIAALEMLVAA